MARARDTPPERQAVVRGRGDEVAEAIELESIRVELATITKEVDKVRPEVHRISNEMARYSQVAQTVEDLEERMAGLETWRQSHELDVSRLRSQIEGDIRFLGQKVDDMATQFKATRAVIVGSDLGETGGLRASQAKIELAVSKMADTQTEWSDSAKWMRRTLPFALGTMLLTTVALVWNMTRTPAPQIHAAPTSVARP